MDSLSSAAAICTRAYTGHLLVNSNDYITIADWLRTVSWSDVSYLTGVVKPVYGISTFPLTTKAV